MVKQGVPQEEAERFVYGVQEDLAAFHKTPEGRKALAKRYARHMLFGILWVVAGLLFTAITYSMAKAGGKYWVAWGAVIFGLYDFFKGLFGWLKYRS